MTTTRHITTAIADLAERKAADLFPDDGYDTIGLAETRSSAAADIRQELAGADVTAITFSTVRPGDQVYWAGAMRAVAAVKRSTLPAHAEYQGLRCNRPQTLITLMFAGRSAKPVTELGSAPVSRIVR